MYGGRDCTTMGIYLMPLRNGLNGFMYILGLPWWLNWWRICLQCRRPGFDPWVGKIPWRRERLPTPVLWPGEFHGLYSLWGLKESDTTERVSLSAHQFTGPALWSIPGLCSSQQCLLPPDNRLPTQWLQCEQQCGTVVLVHQVVLLTFYSMFGGWTFPSLSLHTGSQL